MREYRYLVCVCWCFYRCWLSLSLKTAHFGIQLKGMIGEFTHHVWEIVRVNFTLKILHWPRVMHFAIKSYVMCNLLVFILSLVIYVVFCFFFFKTFTRMPDNGWITLIMILYYFQVLLVMLHVLSSIFYLNSVLIFLKQFIRRYSMLRWPSMIQLSNSSPFDLVMLMCSEIQASLVILSMLYVGKSLLYIMLHLSFLWQFVEEVLRNDYNTSAYNNATSVKYFTFVAYVKDHIT